MMSETTYRFRSGPVNIEVTATESDNHESAIMNALDTAESITEARELGEHSHDVAAATPGDEELRFDSETPSSTPSADGFDDDFIELANRCNIAPEDLGTVIDIDPSREEPPYLLVDSELLGESKREQQMRAPLAILLSWQSYYNREHVSSSDLKDALQLSDINPGGIYHMYEVDGAGRCFDKSGRGRGATVELTRPGVRKAREVLSGLIDAQ